MEIHENENSLYHCRAFLAFAFYFLLCHVIRTDTKAHLRYNTPMTSDWIKIAPKKKTTRSDLLYLDSAHNFRLAACRKLS